jgi:hypothetical protein
LKTEYFVLEITLEDIRMQTVISGLKLQAVPLIKLNADLMEYIVTATIEDQEWQDAHNATKNRNPSANVEYLYDAFITIESYGSQQQMTYIK